MKNPFRKAEPPPQLPRQDVADEIARHFRSMPDADVMGPNSQTGPLGGELEHLNIIVRRGGQEAWVTVNVYGTTEWE